MVGLRRIIAKPGMWYYAAGKLEEYVQDVGTREQSANSCE